MNLYRPICYSGSGNIIQTTAEEFEALVNQVLSKVKDNKPNIQWDVASAGNSSLLTTFCAMITFSENETGNYKTKVLADSINKHKELELNLKNFLGKLTDKNPKVTLKISSAGNNTSIKTFLIFFVEYQVVD